MIPANTEPDKAQTRAVAADLTEKVPGLDMPRWGFYLLIIFAAVVGDEAETFLISRYSLPEAQAFLFSFIPVIMLSLLARVVIKRLSRQGIH